jgi:outer membrane lipoprotein-sorting protein
MHTLPPFPKRYTAEMVCSNGDRRMLYVDGLNMRMEEYPKTGDATILISRPDKHVIWSLSPNTKTYSQAKMPDGMERAFNPDTLYDWAEYGMETIDGRRCRRFVGRYKEARGPIGDAHEVCFVDAKTGMRRRMDSYDMKGKLVATIDYLNAKVGAPSWQVFEMPEGYKRGYHRRKRVVG